MTLGLLQPWALGLLALASLPILAHLTRQRPTDRVAYGAMLLLQRLAKRLRRRRRVQDPWLLAARLLAALAVLLAVAAPELTWTGAPNPLDGSGRVVIVVDTSLSMGLVDRGSTLLARAIGDGDALVRSLPDGAEVGLVTFDAVARPLGGELTTDKSRVLATLGGLQPTPHAGDLRAALVEARRFLGGEPGEVVLLTDEAGPTMIPQAAEEIARLIDTGSSLLPRPVHADPPRNVTVVAAAYGDGLEGGQVTFRVASFGPDRVEVPCDVELPDGATISVFVDVPPFGEAEAAVTLPREAQGGVARIHCEDADLGLDNTRWFHLPPIGATRMLLVDGDPGDTPTRSETYFLQAALTPSGALKAGVTTDVVGVQGLGKLDATVHGVVFLANVSDPRPIAPTLRSFVAQGGTLIVSVGDNAVADRYNGALGSLLPSSFRGPEVLADRAEPPRHLLLPDTSLELFEPFRRSGRSAIGRVGSWRMMTLEPYADGNGVKTLLSYEGGLPALVERRVGRGKVVLWTSSVDLGWSNLPLQSVFLPLMQRLARRSGDEGGTDAIRADATVGQRVTLTLPDGVRDAEVLDPDARLVSVQREGSQIVFVPAAAGAYKVVMTDGPTLGWVAVNLDAAESDVRRTTAVEQVEAELRPEAFVRHADLGGPLMLAALALLLAAGVLAARPRHEEEAA